MSHRPALLLSSIALCALGLAACGGSAAPTAESSSPAAVASAEQTEEATTEVGAATEEEAAEEEATEGELTEEESADAVASDDTATSAEGGDGAAGDGAAAEDPGPAPEAVRIPAGTESNPPRRVGGFELKDGSGPAFLYTDPDTGALIAVGSDLLSSPYSTLAEEIETENTPAGTGSCGYTSSRLSITCYLQAEGGILTISAAPEEISLEDTVVFANQYTEAALTA